MYRPTANELKVLIALKEVGEAQPMRVGSKTGMGSSMAGYLCRYLATHGLVRKSGRKRYKLTPAGQKALEDAFARTLSILRQKEGNVLETLAKISNLCGARPEVGDETFTSVCLDVLGPKADVSGLTRGNGKGNGNETVLKLIAKHFR